MYLLLSGLENLSLLKSSTSGFQVGVTFEMAQSGSQVKADSHVRRKHKRKYTHKDVHTSEISISIRTYVGRAMFLLNFRRHLGLVRVGLHVHLFVCPLT